MTAPAARSVTEDRPGQVDVSVVVVSHNAIEWLPQCLAAVERTARTGRSGVEVVVVDNASTREVRDYLAGRPHGIRLVQLDENVGFARGCAAGVSVARGRRLLFLNPDAVLEDGAVDALVDFLDEDPLRGIVGGRTLTPDGELEPHSCWARPTLWSWFCWASGLTAAFRGSRLFDPEAMGSWRRDSVREVDVVTGCLLMTTQEVWHATGGFDPDFFMYGEDAELSLRARRLGWHPSITPAAVARHRGGASSGHRLGKQELLLRGKVTLARKIWSPRRAAAGRALLVAGVGSRALAETLLRRGDGVNRALWTGRATWVGGYPRHPAGPGALDGRA